MKKNIKTLLSIVLTSAILLTQASVFAVPLIDAMDKIPVSDVFVMAEDVSKRGEFEKHYLCSDGTFIVASYAEAIHYKNENGEWVDVDNEVSYNKSTQSYRAGNETFGVEFASVSDTSKLVTMNSGDYVISWGLTTDKTVSLSDPIISDSVAVRSAELTTPSVTLKNPTASTKNSKSLVTDSKTFELSKASGGIAYEKIIAGSPEISVNYSVYRNKIEEDIYINSKTDAKSISMNLSVGTLVARVNYDNSVWLLDDEGEPQYTIGVPYMEDAAGKILNDIKVTVTQSGSDCVITYTPNEAWLNSEDRVYPILLDPSITSREYSSNIVDTYVYEGNTANHSSERKNLVGIDNSKIHRTFIKIMNLPNIDPSMPVIGATLTFTLPVGSTTGRTVALYKLNSDWNQSTITYANQPSFTEADKIGTCPFNASTRKFTFDLTDDFARMYNEFLAGVNYGYVLKYDDESKTNPDYNATYGMEQTTVAYRPLFTVTYGYSLPTGLEVGGVYALQNRGSYGYLTVHNGTDANDVNVYLKSTASDALGTNQQFKLEYVSSTGAYRFRAMSSSDANGRVLDIVKSGGYVNNGGNVQIYNPTDELANEWFIVGTGFNAFRIVPRTNMSLSLTAYPGLDGTATGTTPTSTGNVFVATTVENDNYQQWRIVDMSTGEGVSGGGNSDIVPNGTYYFNNRGTGRYISRSISVEYVDGSSGLISELGNRIRWTVTCVFDGTYTIRSADDPTLFIVPDDVTSRIALDTLPSGTDIPDEYLWKFTAANGGGVKIQNVGTSEYLYSIGVTNQLASTLPNTSSASYDRYAWRMANVNVYGNTSEHGYRELNANFSIDADTDVNVTTNFVVAVNPVNAIWANAEDFTYSTTDTSIATINGETITGISVGVATVIATHKVTGRQIEFSVGVHLGTFEIHICASGKIDEQSSSAPGTTAGHCWIQVISYSCFVQTIGHYQLPALGQVTIGKWGDVSCGGNEFSGIWYNREKYRNVAAGAFSEYVYLSETIDKSTFDQLSQYIIGNYSGYNLVSSNCVHFAKNAWNLCADLNRTIIIDTCWPDVLERHIKLRIDCCIGNEEDIIGNTIHGYYDGDGYVVCSHN
ncbi:MAG: DNRLRE domain-containing protein [Ruminococcaceae bacterium]|nr:DNRLRE domain-containing protein [Oscillospiraceae bacterium]